MKEPIAYHGITIRDRDEMLSLTDMWKAAGAPENKDPRFWARQESVREFIDVVVAAENVMQEHLFRATRGRNGATWAHWQIGLAYAKYLSPEFHMWCNAVVRERMVQTRKTAAIPSEVIATIERTNGIVRMLVHKVTEMEKAQPLTPAVVEQLVEARIANDPRIAVVNFVSVKQILDGEWKVPSKGRRSIQRKVFLRLSAHCLANGVKAFKCAHSGTWLFPPHEASAFVREHCGDMIREHMSKQKGQGVLKLVPKKHEPPRGAPASPLAS